MKGERYGKIFGKFYKSTFDRKENPIEIKLSSEKNEQLKKIRNSMFSREQKGVVELLWDIFGGTINEQGHKVLDPHIGCIYGDSITLERAEEICKRLKQKGFASTNVVLGVGSYSLSYATRDSQGVACKATWCVVNGEERKISKDPITDNGEKKSAKGLLMVYEKDDVIKLKDQCTKEEEESGLLKTVFENGYFQRLNVLNLTQIRENILKKINF
jgi:nicotinamide phosphoribosyltransferase